MRDALANGRLTKTELRDMKQAALVAHYGGSRETACKARDAVLSEFVTNSITDK